LRINKIILSFCFAIFATGLSQGKEWHGIVPLHPTRADVERLLGRPKEPMKDYVSIHETEREVVLVEYSTGEPCSGGVNQWRVQRGTVLSISVAPKTEVRFADLQLDISKYKVADGGHVPNYTYYTSVEEGTQLEVTQGLVMSISYFAAATDANLKCPGSRTSTL
jgi:hypothetical protein